MRLRSLLLAAVLSALVLAQSLTPATVLGGALIAGAVVLLQRGGRGKMESQSAAGV